METFNGGKQKAKKQNKKKHDILIRSSISRLPEISLLLGHAVHTPLAPSLPLSLSLSCTHTPEHMPFVSCQRARPALLILSSLILFSAMCRPTQSCGRLPPKDVIHTNIYTCSARRTCWQNTRTAPNAWIRARVRRGCVNLWRDSVFCPLWYEYLLSCRRPVCPCQSSLSGWDLQSLTVSLEFVGLCATNWISSKHYSWFGSIICRYFPSYLNSLTVILIPFPAAMVELDGDEVRISSRGRYAERDIVQVRCLSVFTLKASMTFIHLWV